MLVLRLPYPPSANRYWRNSRNGVYMSPEAKAYKQQAAILARNAGVAPLSDTVALYLDLYRPRAAGDLDNRIKVLVDALNGVAYHDDSQITEIHALRFDEPKQKGVKREGYVLVRVEAVPVLETA